MFQATLLNTASMKVTRTAKHLTETRTTRFMGDQNNEIELLSDSVCQLK